MTKMKKSSYATPIIKVVTFQVEEGFQGTGGYKIGSDQTQGVQDYDVINIDPNTGSASGWVFRN